MMSPGEKKRFLENSVSSIASSSSELTVSAANLISIDIFFNAYDRIFTFTPYVSTIFICFEIDSQNFSAEMECPGIFQEIQEFWHFLTLFVRNRKS